MHVLGAQQHTSPHLQAPFLLCQAHDHSVVPRLCLCRLLGCTKSRKSRGGAQRAPVGLQLSSDKAASGAALER